MDLEILKMASDTKNHKVIDEYTHISKQKNHLCGDEMQISLILKNNKIIDFGYQCKSCIFCQASVSLLSRKVINKSVDNIKKFINLSDSYFSEKLKQPAKEWDIFKKILNVKNISRKECLLLPFKTLLKALNS